MNRHVKTAISVLIASVMLCAFSIRASDRYSSLLKPVNREALVSYLKDLGDRASGRLEQGLSYVQIAAFTSIREAHRTYGDLPGFLYGKLLYVKGDGYIRLLLGPYVDAENYLPGYRKRFGRDVFLVRAGREFPGRDSYHRSYEQSIITELEPDLDYVEIGSYTNEADSRRDFESSVRLMFERRIFLAGDGVIRLLVGPFVSGEEILREARLFVNPDARILSGSREILYPVPPEVNLLVNRKIVKKIRKESAVRLYTGLNPPDVTGVYRADWTIPGLPAEFGYITNCSVTISGQTADGKIKVRFDQSRFPVNAGIASGIEDGFISGNADNFTIYLAFVEHEAVAWSHSVIVMSGNRTPAGDLGNFRLCAVLKEKYDPAKLYTAVNSLSDITELDGVLTRTAAIGTPVASSSATAAPESQPATPAP